jgi:dUTP pyrophosphatase
MQIKVKNHSKHELPKYQTLLSAGMDLRANLDGPVTLLPMSRVLIPTGIYMNLKAGTEAQIRPRSGLAYKHGITVLNSPGTVDADFVGEIKVLLINLSGQPFLIEDGERIAQMVIARHETVSWVEAEELESSERGQGGFGSTGTK